MKMGISLRAFLSASILAILIPCIAEAQQEFPPPSGKGKVVVVLSGAGGPGYYGDISRSIAALGYDVVLFDSNKLLGTQGRALRDAISLAQTFPHAAPGKVGLVGFSAGGQLGLGYGSLWAREVAIVAAWYPATDAIKDLANWASHITVPVVMFAGTDDVYKLCCLIDKARELASAAKAHNAPFELTTYAGAHHGFNLPGPTYNAQATKDALSRTLAALQKYLGN
jgi:dienelactone hydrolase